MMGTMTEQTQSVLTEIAVERLRQVEVHHWSEAHDDLHGVEDWAWLIARRSVAICHRDAAQVEDSRRLLLECAAIAVAAIEAIDRTQA